MSLSKMLQEYREGLRGLPNYEELAEIASSEQCADPIVERNVSLLRQRSTVGVQKYGTTLADNKLPLRAWLNHALEESLDQANYLQKAMAKIDSDVSKVEDATESAELFGIGYLVDGVNMHPSRVTVLRPSTATAPTQEQEPAAYTAGSHDIFELIREWAHKPEGERYEAARKIIGYVNSTYTAGVSDGKFLGATSAPVQPVAVPDDIPAEIPKAIPEKDHYVYLRGYYDGERAAITAKVVCTPQ